jgi:hypothetical protein
MTTLEIINDLISKQPKGSDLLNSIKVNMNDVQKGYDKCELMKKIIDIKFADKQQSGYTLKEILDIGTGVVSDEVEKFVLNKLQTYINANAEK